SVRTASFQRIWPWFCLLAWISLWIQAYLFVIVIAVFCAAAVQTAARSREGFRTACSAAVVMSLGTMLLMWVSGFFWDRSAVKPLTLGIPPWYDRTSMNLLSPLVPQWSWLFPRLATSVGPTLGPWGSAVIDATGGQYEGYNYLGAGTLLLVTSALVFE